MPSLRVVVPLVLAVVALVVPGSAGAIPSGRVYEQVSPTYKGGFGAVFIEAAALDGNSVAFFSPGQFAGSLAGLANTADGLAYVARRGASGWSTVPISPPDLLVPYVNIHDISPDLLTEMVLAKSGPTVEAAALEGNEVDPLLHDTEAPDLGTGWEMAAPPLKTLTGSPFEISYEGASVDFCHVLLNHAGEGSDESFQFVKQAVGAEQPLYEISRGCGGESAGVRLVSATDTSRPLSPGCTAELGIGSYASIGSTHVGNQSNAVSADGSEVFFTTCIEAGQSDHQLFVRLGGARTVEVSRPLHAKLEVCGQSQLPCPAAAARASADYAGASEDGSKVFFTTAAPLVSADTDSGNDVYMAEIGCPAGEPGCPAANRRVTGLVQVSHAPDGEAGGVVGVVRVAPDGAHVYFVATGDLLSSGAQATLAGEGRAVPEVGADNFYVYDTLSGQMSFIGDLCAGYELSGGVEDSHCQSKGKEESDVLLWSGGDSVQAQTAGAEGQFLVFSTYAQLSAGDIDTAKDVYRYDAETGSLERVSLGEEGYSSNGNGPFDATITVGSDLGSVQEKYELGKRAISEDGTRIIFETVQPLSPAAINGLANIYEWHESPGSNEGSVSLLSGGVSEQPVTDAVISPSGRDVFFVTTAGLVPQDTDGLDDIYDARLSGGFGQVPTTREACSSDACQGPLTNSAPLLVPGSVSQAPEAGVPAPAATLPKSAARVKSAKCRKGYVKKKGKCVKAKPARKTRKVSKSDRRGN
ncbi:MAG TPA: hypothetical protein VGL57_08520 [Solirubrobacteraceae bacterium]